MENLNETVDQVKDTDNNSQEEKTVEVEETKEQEVTFSQKDVDRIVKERLARYQTDLKNELAELKEAKEKAIADFEVSRKELQEKNSTLEFNYQKAVFALENNVDLKIVESLKGTTIEEIKQSFDNLKSVSPKSFNANFLAEEDFSESGSMANEVIEMFRKRSS